MNQKDIAAIRKHFKLNAEAVKIADIYNIYIRQDSNEIFYEELRSFPLESARRQNRREVVRSEVSTSGAGPDRPYADVVV